jgi:hypothetical protein
VLRQVQAQRLREVAVQVGAAMIIQRAYSSKMATSRIQLMRKLWSNRDHQKSALAEKMSRRQALRLRVKTGIARFQAVFRGQQTRMLLRYRVDMIRIIQRWIRCVAVLFCAFCASLVCWR